MKKRNLKKPIITTLEQRILFDGAAVATAVDVLDNSSFSSNESSSSTSNNDATLNSAENSVHDAQAVQGFEKDRREVAFVDVTVKDYQTLVDGVGEGTEVYLVSSLDEIKTTLSSQTNIDAIHILSHGNTGEITVGNDVLNSTTLDDNAQLLETMKNSLSVDGDILLYGCNVSSDGTGQKFINSIATLTQADVAASDDITGNSALGGDWELEKNSGSIETDNFSIFDYQNLLVQNFTSVTSPVSDWSTISGNAAWLTGDFNNDGAVDIIEQTTGQAEVFKYINDGNGNFTATSIIPATTNLNLTATKAADYDNDGDLDLLTVVNNAADIYYRNDGSGNFTSVTSPVSDWSTISGNAAWLTGDFNNDGAVDIIEQTTGQAEVFKYINDGNGNFTATSIIPATTNLNLTATKAADYDNDGDLDLLTVVNNAADIYYRNDGSGNFTSVTSPVSDWSTISGNAAWLTGDLNNDGAVDIIEQTTGQAEVFKYINDGNGNFTATSIIPATTNLNLTATKAADYDNDGDLDLLTVVNNAADIYYRNDNIPPTLTSFTPTSNTTGVGVSDNIVLNFTHANTLNKGTGTIYIKVDNGDGNLANDTTFESFSVSDVRVSLSGNSTSSVVTINPTGTFAPNTNYYLVISPTAFVDSDGKGFVSKIGNRFHSGIPNPAVTQAGNSLDTVSDKTILSFTTSSAVDTTPPTFDIVPATSNVTATSLSLNASLDEAGKIYYVVVADGATAPSIAQIKAGQDSTGASALKSGNSDVTTTPFTGTYNITGLSANTAYDIYVIGQDDEGTPNVMATATKVDVTTAIASTAVGFTGDSGNTNSPNATVANGSQSSISITNTATNDTLSISTTGTNYYQDTATTFSNLGITPLSGGSGMLFYADKDTTFTNSITFTIQGNKVFDFNKILLQEINDETDTFTFTPNGDVSKRVTFSFNNTETKLIDLSSNTNFDGITSLTISTLDNQFQASFDNIEVENIRSASDTTPPTFDVTPSTSNVTATTVDLSASLDEAGKIYYVVVADGATAPSIAQIKAGQDSSGASALKSGNSDVSTTPFTGTYNITGLSANTAYDVYVVGQDDEGTPNVMASATKVDVTTTTLNITFDFESNVTGFDTTDVRQTVSNETLKVISSTSHMDGAINTGGTQLSGNESLFTASNYINEISTTFSLVSGKTFDLTSLKLKDNLATQETVTITSSKGSATFSINASTLKFFDSSIAGFSNLQGVSSFTVTVANAGNSDDGYGIIFDDIYLTNILDITGPTVSVATVSYTDTAVNDTFTNTTGTISATASSGSIIGYGISGGTTGGNTDVGGTIYDVSKAGTYGTLYVKSSDGSYVYVPTSDSVINATTSTVTDVFTIQATDGAGTGNGTLTITINGVNDTPVLSAPTSASYIDTSATDTFSNTTGTLSASDRDTGATLSYGINTGTTGGSTLIGGITYDVSKTGTYGTLYVVSTGADKGKYAYVPTANVINALTSNATDTFTVSSSDGSLSNTQTFTVNITGVNDTPTAADKTITINEDTATVLSVSDFGFSDVDTGSALSSVKITSLASDGTLEYNNGTSWVAVTLNQVILVSDITGNKLRFNPSLNENGTTYATFNFMVNDGTIDSSAKTVTYNVTAVNDTPTVANTITDQNASVSNTFSFVVPLNTFADVDTSDTFTYTAQLVDSSGNLVSGGTLPSWLTFTAGTRTFSGTPALSDTGTIYVKVTATDNGTGTLSVSDTFTITTNSGPTVSVATVSYTDTAVNDTFTNTTGTISATASSGSIIGYGISGGTTGGNTDVGGTIYDVSKAGTYGTLYVKSSNGNYVYVPTSNSVINATTSTVTDVFTIQATDGSGTTGNSLTITINGVNEAPVITSAATATAIDENSGAGQVVYTVTSTDVDVSATVTYSLSGTDASLFTIDSTTGAVTLTANPNFETKSSYSFNVIATDNGTLTDTKAVTLAINNVNEAPVITSAATATAIDENSGAGQVVYTVTSTDVDVSATVTYSLSGTDASLFTIDSTTGAVTLTANPNFETKSSYSFNVIATDNGTLTDTKAVTLAINNVNEAPVITSAATATAIDENSGAGQVVYTVTSTDVDVSATVTYSLSGTDASLFTIDSTTGAVTLTANPNFETKSSYSFNVIATDNGTLTDTKAVTLAINNVNEAPVITSAATATAIDENSGAGQVVYTVTSTDVDVSATVTYSLSGTDASLFTIDSTTGAVTLTANPNFETKSSYSFNVIATDNGTLTDTKAVTLAINNVNEAPVITSAATATAIDENSGAGQVVYTVTSTDVDVSATVTYSLSGTDASLFTIDSTTGAVTLTANPNFETKSSYSFNVIATDNGTLTDTKAVTLAINNVNEAPVITSAATATAIDENSGAGQVVYTVTSTDVDVSATVTYSLSGTDASLFTIDSTTGAVTLTANPNFETKSSYSFNVIATDNGTLTDTKAVTLAINNVNEAPVITSAATATAIDENSGAGQVVYTVTSTDVDVSATVTYSLSGTDASLFTIDSTTGAVTLTANPNFETKSSYSFNVIATDNGTLTDTKAVTLAINNVNEAPVITSAATATAIDENSGAGQVVYTVTSTDVDVSATVTYSLSGTDASLFTIDSTTGAVTLTANPNFETKSSYSFNVIATDNGTLTDTKAVTLAINNVNEAPVITSAATATAIDENSGAGQVVYTVTSTDVDVSATVTYSLSGTDASLFTIDSTTGAVTLTANPNFETKSSYSFNVIATDNGTLTDTKAVTLAINNVNEAPVITSAATATAIDENSGAGQVVYTVTSTDVDVSATVTYSLSGTDASLFTIDSTTGAVTLTANPNFETKSSYSFNVIATDNGTLTDTKAVTLAINNVNEAPVITSAATATAIDENSGAGQVVYTVTSTDVDVSATVTYSLSGTDASLFTIDSTTGAVTLTANPNFETKSSYSFNVIATDNGTLTDTKAVTLAINNVNEAPVITSAATATAIDENSGAGQVVYTVTSTDVDVSATVTYSLSGTDASLFTIDSTTGAVTLTANPNFETKSSYSFNVIATDNGTLTDTKAVTLAINNVNEAPAVSLENINSQLSFGDNYTKDISVLFNDIDFDNVFTYEAVNLPQGLNIDPSTGVISGKVNQSGEFVITIKVTDNGIPALSVSRTYNMLVIAPPQVEVPPITPTTTPSNNTPIISVAEIGITTFTDIVSLGTINNNPFKEASDSVGIGFLNNSVTSTQEKTNTQTNNSDNQVQTVSTNRNNNGNYIEADASVNVNSNGQVTFDKATQDSFSVVGIAIEDMKIENNRLEIKVVDTSVAQNFVVTKTDGTALPTGISFDPKTGNISGTVPENLDKLDITIKATNADGTTRVLNIKVDLKKLKEASRADAENYIGLKEQLVAENQKLENYGDYLVSLFA